VAGNAAAHPGVQVVQGAGVDTHQYLVGGRSGVGALLEQELVHISVITHHDGLHVSISKVWCDRLKARS
jgi:hypothetical protein